MIRLFGVFSGKQRQRLSAQIAEGGEQAPTHVSRQARLPEVKDPKLFMIKVKVMFPHPCICTFIDLFARLVKKEKLLCH